MAVSETWRDVPGYGGKYQASDMGHIANTFWHGQKRKNGGRTILTQYKRKPRGKTKLQSVKRYVHLTDLEGNMREFSAAKIVAETFLGPVPAGKVIFHKKRQPGRQFHLEPGFLHPAGIRPHDRSGQLPAASAEIQRRR